MSLLHYWNSKSNNPLKRNTLYAMHPRKANSAIRKKLYRTVSHPSCRFHPKGEDGTPPYRHRRDKDANRALGVSRYPLLSDRNNPVAHNKYSGRLPRPSSTRHKGPSGCANSFFMGQFHAPILPVGSGRMRDG